MKMKNKLWERNKSISIAKTRAKTLKMDKEKNGRIQPWMKGMKETEGRKNQERDEQL